jgi:hypothetical protein
MKRSLLTGILVLVLSAAALGGGVGSRQGTGSKKDPLPWPAGLPVYDHIVIVVEENQHPKDVFNPKLAPYINDVLKAEGANFTQMYGEEHNSQGNYFWLFSGSNHNIGFEDQVPAVKLSASNLAFQLHQKKGLSFKGYAEGLPEIGSTVHFAPDPKNGPYARKHAPWVSFDNVSTSCNVPFSGFPTTPDGFAKLPTVAFVIPNLDNDMHNGPSAKAIPQGSQWLKDNIDPYYQWAKTHNSLLILTFDENKDLRHYKGLTNPFVKPKDEYWRDVQNQIVTIFAGAHIKAGEYPEDRGITHVNILRTIEAMYRLPRSGAQQPNAAGGGITDDYLIRDVFK